jgi:hypothetical protein
LTDLTDLSFRAARPEGFLPRGFAPSSEIPQGKICRYLHLQSLYLHKTIDTTQIGLIPKWVNIDILCIGNNIKSKPLQLRPEDAVFFTLDAKAERILDLYAKDFWKCPEK